MPLLSLDSNILIYAEGTDDLVKRDIVIAMIGHIGPENILLPMQSAGETLRWMIRKGKLERGVAVRKIEWWLGQCVALPVSVAAFRKACTLVERNAFQLWDAVIFSASSEAGAEVLLSEDMQHGFSWGGVTILNPFTLNEQQRLQLTSAQSTMH